MQIIIILKKFNDFFACKIVLDANHHYPENIPKFFCLQSCLRRKSSLSRNYSKTLSPARLSWPQIIIIQEIFKKFSPAKLSYLQIILILKIFKDFFACKIVFDATHHYPENIQKLFSCKIVLAANHHFPEIIQRLFGLQ